MRKYATERVQYDIIVMDKVLESDEVQSAIFKNISVKQVRDSIIALNLTPEESIDLERILQFLPELKNELLLDGAIDISDVVSAALTARPALGAVLTYRQSWYPQGLALGHLLHSMALAPGESTIIAMVDWTRADKGNLTEDTAQAENLAANINHTRSIGEVTSAVAKEAQSGFSRTDSDATQQQTGTTSGESSLYDKGTVGVDSTGVNAGFGLGVSSTGVSNANAHTVGWASSNSSSTGDRTLNATMQQNINDKTQQESNSVRNRRATTVKETTQKENENLSTRIVTNYNHMHALTVQYFEVVQIYKVILELSKVTPCLFVPMKLVTFTEQVIKRYRNVIAAAGLIPEIRALSYLEPNQLAVEIPNRISNWEYINEINVGFRAVIGKDNSQILYIPFEKGLFLYKVGVSDPNMGQMFSALIVTLADGTRKEFPLQNDGQPFHSDFYEPNYYVPLVSGTAPNFTPLIEADKISLISLKVDATQLTVEAETGVMLTFNVFGNQIVRPAVPVFRLKGRVKASPLQQEVPIFRIQKSLSDESISNHLDENALYYSTAIWNSLDAATITTMLSSYTLSGKKRVNGQKEW